MREVSKGGKKEPKSGMSFPGGVCLAGDRSSCGPRGVGCGGRGWRELPLSLHMPWACTLTMATSPARRVVAGEAGHAEKLLDGVVANTRKNVIGSLVFPKATGKMISKSLDDQIGDKVGRARTTVSARSPFEF